MLSRLARVPDRVILVAFCLVFSLQALASVARKSATFDEPSDLVSGYLELTRGRYWVKPETLPFAKMVAAAPLLGLSVALPPLGGDRATLDARTLYELNDGATLLRAARAAVLPFSLGLGILVFLWTRRLFGRGAAAFALLLYAFEPNLIAHAALVTTDLAVACLFFLTLYACFRLLERASLSRLAVLAAALSLALVTKLSMLVLVGLLAVIGLAVSVSDRPIPLTFRAAPAFTLRGRGGKLAAFALAGLAAAVAAYAVIWATYRFHYTAAAPFPGRMDCPGWLPTGPIANRALDWLRRARALPEPYLYNFFVHRDLAPFMPGYLFGEVRQGGFWYYFVVTLALKTPLPLLILMGLGLTLYARHWRRAPLATLCLVLPAAVYFVAISASRFNIGHRHLLPMLPLLITLTGAVVPWAAARGAAARWAVAALTAWHLAASLAIFPDYLTYFNELAGGPGGGGRYLADSNLDWGQDLGELERYMARHGIDRVWLSYFGTASPDYYGIAYDRLPGSTFVGPAPARDDFQGRDRLPRLRGAVAISVTNLSGIYLPCFGLSPHYFAAYRDLEPTARIGYSINLYRLE